MNEQTKTRTPSKVRFALLVFCGVYPLVTLGLGVLGPLTATWPLPLKTLVLVPIIVVAMVLGDHPLYPNPSAPSALKGQMQFGF